MLDIFQGFERTVFPESECTIPNAREPEVKDSDSVYLCVVVDSRFAHNLVLEYLRPYTCIHCEDGSILYGWARVGFDGTVDHCTRCVHDDYERVVAWKKVGAALDVHDVFGVPHAR